MIVGGSKDLRRVFKAQQVFKYSTCQADAIYVDQLGNQKLPRSVAGLRRTTFIGPFTELVDKYQTPAGSLPQTKRNLL